MGVASRGSASFPCADDHLLLGSCCAALATLVPISLYQTGVIPCLPDPPSRLFSSERITTSRDAYPFGIPDGLLGLGSFGTTLALAVLSRRSATARKLLGAKLTMDVSMAGFNAVRQVVSFGKLCSWCMGTALATAAMAYGGREIIRETWSEAAALLQRDT